MSWISRIPPADSDGRLRRLYERVAGPGGAVDNILEVHSLRPHTLEGHLALYKAVLHHTQNVLPKWLLETIGVQVSRINRCDYCVDHHFAGLCRLIGDHDAASVRAAIEDGRPSARLGPRELAILGYTERLTRTPEALAEADIAVLRDAGLTDGEILEANQVAAYFAYANRTVLGLGVDTAGDILGLSPGGDGADDWAHG